MRRSGRHDHACSLQFDWIRSRVVEQADPVTEQHRHEVNVQLVQKALSDALLGDIRTHHGDVLVTGGRGRLRDGGCDAVSDERDRPLARYQVLGALWVTTNAGSPYGPDG